MFGFLLWPVVLVDVYWVMIRLRVCVYINLSFACIQSPASDVFKCCGVSEFAKPERDLYLNRPVATRRCRALH